MAFKLSVSIGGGSRKPRPKLKERLRKLLPHRGSGEAAGEWAKRHPKAAVALVILVPLLLVGGSWVGAWLAGYVSSPTLEKLTGHHPAGQVTFSGQHQALLVQFPANGDVLTSTAAFGGIATPGSKLYMWEEPANVPLSTPVDAQGRWSFQFDPYRLAPGTHTLSFAENTGTSWGPIVRRTIDIETAPLSSEPAPSPFGAAVASIPLIGSPLFTIFSAVSNAATSGVSIVVTSTTGMNLQNDANQDGVGDWLQSSPISPTSVPAIIPTPAWLNLGILILLIVAPLMWVIITQPEWFKHLLKQREERKRLFARLSTKARMAEVRGEASQAAARANAEARKIAAKEEAALKREAVRAKAAAFIAAQRVRSTEQAALANASAAQRKAVIAARERLVQADLRAKERLAQADLKREQLRLAQEREKSKRPAGTTIKIGHMRRDYYRPVKGDPVDLMAHARKEDELVGRKRGLEHIGNPGWGMGPAPANAHSTWESSRAGYPINPRLVSGNMRHKKHSLVCRTKRALGSGACSC